MRFYPFVVILICFFLNLVDGMDVLVISYTAPLIASSWSVSDDTLGMVFSSGLLGMSLGALLLAPYADNIGRKKIILIGIVIVSIGVLFTGFSINIYQLILLRFFTGIGIGALLATTVSIVSEYSPEKSKDFWISFVLAGYPIGAILAGYISNIIIVNYNWQNVFIIFGVFSAFFIPIVYFFISDSDVFFNRDKIKDYSNQINLISSDDSHSKIKQNLTSKAFPAVLNLFSKSYFKNTIRLWIAFFFSFICLYFLISWIPKLVTEAGLSLSLGIYSGTVFNLGAFFGIITQGYISTKFGLKNTIFLFLVTTTIIMSLITFFLGSDIMLLIFAFLGFTIQGGFVGLYSLAARIYPHDFRTTGIGWGIGAGRLGAVLGPLAAGFLIASGLGISINFLVFAIPTLISAIAAYSIVITKNK